MSSRYVLTYELKVLYCQNIHLNTGLKEINLNNLQFSQFSGDRDDFENGYVLDPDSVNQIIQDVLSNKIGYELPSDKLEWMMKFENLLKKNMSLILKKNLAYNYFILKLMLLGFTEEIAKDIVCNYYINIESNKNVQHPQVFLKNINRLLKEKLFWVPYDLEKEKEFETSLYGGIIRSKLEMAYQFTFNEKIRQDSLSTYKNGIVNTLIKHNQTESFCVTPRLNPIDLAPYVLKVYMEEVEKLVVDLYYSMGYYPNEMFIKDLNKNVENTVKHYIALSYSRSK